MDGLKELNLLFLEDNEEFANNTIEFLGIYFKNIFHATSVQNAIKLFNDNKVDVIISDIKVHDGSGLAFVQKVRETNNEIPIVILSAHKEEDFLFKAIRLRIISYELKPLSYDKFMKLLERLQDIFKPKHILNFNNGIKYDFEKKEFEAEGKSIKLANQEILFVELMIKNIDKIVTTDMIQRSVWQEKTMSESALKNLLFRLRKKMGYDFITTIQCLGYKLTI
ncbi:MAG: response regulator [Campylobacterales bacterium]|nr:response regulator [Campylobacterales bacterium]